MKGLCKCFEKYVELTLIKKNELYENFKADLAECEKKEFQEKDADLTKVLDGVMQVLTHLFKMYPEAAATILEPFKNHYFSILDRENSSYDEKIAALSLFVDYIEATGDLLAQNGHIPLLDKAITDVCKCANVDPNDSNTFNETFIQNSVFLIGLISQKTGKNVQIWDQQKVNLTC